MIEILETNLIGLLICLSTFIICQILFFVLTKYDDTIIEKIDKADKSN